MLADWTGDDEAKEHAGGWFRAVRRKKGGWVLYANGERVDRTFRYFAEVMIYVRGVRHEGGQDDA